MEHDNIDNQFFTTREETEAWLNSMYIENYTINDDLTVDVEGNVDIFNKGLKYIPVQFGYVSGDFNCSNNQLTSLKGTPFVVEETFYAQVNKITSISHMPRKMNSLFIQKNPLIDFMDLNFEVTNGICLTSSMDYFVPSSNGNVVMIFSEFKQLQMIQNLKDLNEKLSRQLPLTNTLVVKHKI